MSVNGASKPQCVLDIFVFVEFNMNNKHNYYSPTLNSIPFTLSAKCTPSSNTRSLAHFFFPGCSVFPQVLCEVWQQRLRKPHLISFSDPVGCAETHFLPPSNSRFRFSKSIFVWKLWLWPLNSTPLGSCEVANLGRFPLECLLRSLWRNGIKLLSLNTTTHFHSKCKTTVLPDWCCVSFSYSKILFCDSRKSIWLLFSGIIPFHVSLKSYVGGWGKIGCSTIFVFVLTKSAPWS